MTAPIAFRCSRQRRDTFWRYGEPEVREHNVVRTGRTRPNPSRRRGARVLDKEYEYRCSCGHVGWSRHAEIIFKPLEDQ